MSDDSAGSSPIGCFLGIALGIVIIVILLAGYTIGQDRKSKAPHQGHPSPSHSRSHR